MFIMYVNLLFYKRLYLKVKPRSHLNEQLFLIRSCPLDVRSYPLDVRSYPFDVRLYRFHVRLAYILSVDVRSVRCKILSMFKTLNGRLTDEVSVERPVGVRFVRQSSVSFPFCIRYVSVIHPLEVRQTNPPTDFYRTYNGYKRY